MCLHTNSMQNRIDGLLRPLYGSWRVLGVQSPGHILSATLHDMRKRSGLAGKANPTTETAPPIRMRGRTYAARASGPCPPPCRCPGYPALLTCSKPARASTNCRNTQESRLYDLYCIVCRVGRLWYHHNILILEHHLRGNAHVLQMKEIRKLV